MTFLIGIDPDLHKSGVAVWNSELKSWLIHKSIPNEDIIEVLIGICPPESSKIYLEAGWLNKKSNFRGGNYRVAQAKARNVGENHAAGKMLVKMLEKAGYKVFLVQPLSKGKGLLKTKEGRWTEPGKKYIIEKSGIVGAINDDVRDSIYLVEWFK
ncbi:hypothetical protein [Dyadobacter bucti]|uniref:hypothetical protein n=1 Tax=Dyadobacter bucti TaxID=2572203 RepID=UPI001109C0D8|nr:hypothetical protein [Dyadobacter bucti]